MTSVSIHETKNTAETVVVGFDFTSRLGLAETITSAVVTPTVFAGVDATPEALLSGAESVLGAVVSQTITAGEAGVIYNLSCAATTSAGQVLIINILLAVVSINPF